MRAVPRLLSGGGLAAALLWLAPLAAFGEEACTLCPGAASAASSGASPDFTHFFGDTRYLQAMGDQVSLGTQKGPLPFTLSGNVQTWTSGPPQGELYTEVLQASYSIDSEWKLLGQQLYQQQDQITLWNFVGGFNYKPDDALSVNAMVGAGVNTLYTYQWTAYVSPQYTVPWTLGGQKRIAIEADFTYESYELGDFYQVRPKVSVNVASWLPQLQLGYAYGEFENSTSVTRTQYYQPQPVRGFNLTAVLKPFDSTYLVLSYLPDNLNYIAGSYSSQSTIGATMHLNLTDTFRASLFYQDTWYDGGSDMAFGGGISTAF